MEVGKIAKSDDTRINDEITASSCRLIGVDGSQLGLFAIRDAQRVADDQGLDLVEMFPDADNVSAVRYRDGELRSIDRYLEQNAANMDVEGKAALEDMRDALSGFVYAPMPAEGFRSLATYERARGELGAADATLLQSIRIEPETPSRAEARALLLESIASLPDPKVYELSTKMPPLILLSYLQAALPSLFLLLPVVVASLACTHLQCRSLLVLQIPATAHVRFLTAVALALLLGLVLLLVSMVPAVVVSVIKNGAGGSEYPVALIRAGASTTSTVGEAVLCSIDNNRIGTCF